jgi:hypothetical protein
VITDCDPLRYSCNILHNVLVVILGFRDTIYTSYTEVGYEQESE